MPISLTRQGISTPIDSSIDRCPFFDAGGGICRASFSAMAVNGRRQDRYCHSEDHDGCALFLAKTLRSQRPVSFSLQLRELEIK